MGTFILKAIPLLLLTVMLFMTPTCNSGHWHWTPLFIWRTTKSAITSLSRILKSSLRCEMDLHEGAAHGEGVLDLSRLNLNTLSLVNISEERKMGTKQLYLSFNRLPSLPGSVCMFSNLEFLDISNNGLSVICEGITWLTKLRTLIAKNNRLDEFSLPKEFGSLPLEVLNLSGNRFEEMPAQFLKLQRLQSLSLGGNRLQSIPAEIENLTRYVDYIT